MTYQEFLHSKTRRVGMSGFEANDFPAQLFPWQVKIVQWACKKGRAAIWADTGLGKTAMQLAWAEQVHRQTGKPVLILTPIAVSRQTEAEAGKFGICATVVEENSSDAIQITNYEKLHRFDASVYGGVVLDESSILKSFMGKTKRGLVETFRETPYKLACTATPAPNDNLELLNHCEFLGIMNSNECLSRWFINDSMKAGNYRLKAHAKRDFWGWVSSWAVAMRTPADLGYPNDGYDLPPLLVQHVTIPTENIRIGGALFADASLSATTLHEVLRQTAPMRADKAQEICAGLNGQSVLLWTHTNYEADEIRARIKTDEVRGSDDDDHKEKMLLGFANGSVKRLLTKPTIAGFGMNWQVCHTMIFVGMDYSYEKFYQAVRRCWRYGQTKPVTVYCLATDMEWRLFDALAKKQAGHEQLQAEMIGLMKEESCWT